MKPRLATLVLLCMITGTASAEVSKAELAELLKKYPKADINGDGRLSEAEATAHRKKLTRRSNRPRRGVKRTFKVNPGWNA